MHTDVRPAVPPARRRAGLLAAVVALPAALAACAGGSVAPAERIAEEGMRDAQARIASHRTQLAAEDTAAIRRSDGVFTSALVRRNDRGDALPREWERPDGFTLRRPTPMQMFEIASAITEITRIPVAFAPDVLSPLPATGVAPLTPGLPGAPGAPGGGVPVAAPDINQVLAQMGLQPGGQLPFAGGSVAGATGNVIRPVLSTRNAMRPEFTGRLSVFLNTFASHFGVGWEYTGGEIRVFRNMTRTFTINALPAQISLNTSQTADTSTSGGGGSGGGSGGVQSQGAANQRVTTDAAIRIWEELTAQVGNIVGQDGRVTSSVSTGSITVTAPGPVMSRVQAYMDRQNERLSRQVTVAVQVLSVELQDSDNLQLDVQGLFGRAADFGIAFGNTGGALRALNGIAPVGLPGSPSLSFGITNPSSQWAGSGALFEALSRRGRVRVSQMASVTTMNGIPAPLQVANTRGYLASVSTTDGTTAGGGTGVGTTAVRQTLVPGSVTTGFSMSLLPRVNEASGSLMMQFAINLSELVGPNDGFRTFTSGQNTIQLPDVNTRSFVQQAEIPNGSSLVLTGFLQDRDSAERRGVGVPEFVGLGGRQSATRTRTAIVVVLTPQVVNQRAITVD